MCEACLARGQFMACDRDRDHDTSFEYNNDAALNDASGNERASATIVNDERSIQYHLDGGTNWRWNGDDVLGTSVIVTYDFSSGSELPSTSNYNPYGASYYSSFTEAQKDNFRTAAAEFMAAAGIILVEVDSDAMINVFNSTGSQVGGWAGLPYVNENYTSEVNLVIDSYGSYSPGSYGYYTVVHELGHAVGLDHTHQGAYQLASNLDSTANTVMSYNYDSNYTGLQSLDIAALQTMYGETASIGGWDYEFNGTAGRLVATGSSNDDVLEAFSGKNRVNGLGGDDEITGNNAKDVLRGDGGNDTLRGEDGNDFLRGGRGDDALYGGDGNDYLNGGSGNDALHGGSGSDVLLGRTGHDTLNGEDGNDILDGFWGEDTLNGGAGVDVLTGGWGMDTMNGGSGADRFVFGAGDGADVIQDFETGTDLIDFRTLNLSYSDLTITAHAGGSLISYAGQSVHVENVLHTAWTESDFML